MKLDRIDYYWSNFFGLKRDELNTKGVIVVPHKYLEDYNGAWIFNRNNRIIISAPIKMINKITDKIKILNIERANMFSKQYLNYLFGEKIERIIGPTYQGYYDDAGRKIQVSEEVVKISFEEHHQLIKRLSDSGRKEDWSNSGINKDNDGIYGYFYKNNIESIGCYNIIKGDVGFIGVYTNPNYRGMGFSYEVVKKILKDLSIEGKLIIYQTLISNKSSISLANKVGFKGYANNIAIRLKKNKE